MNTDQPEEMMDAFKAAALSVTKLYKTSATAQAKARSDGYQDCLDDVLAFLDREKNGLEDGDGWKIMKRWATERLDGRESVVATVESEDEVDKVETAVSSPELLRTSPPMHAIATETEAMQRDSAPPTIERVEPEDAGIVVPTLDAFNFQSHIPYPLESNLTLANLDLSDGRQTDGAASRLANSSTSKRPSRRHGGHPARSGSRSSVQLGRGGGQKRKMNTPLDIDSIFNIAAFGPDPKDTFGSRSAKRNRYV